MKLQKGQQVVLDGSVARTSMNGQRAVLLDKDVASGRFRARLIDEPWRTVKVNRGQIQAVLPSEEVPQEELVDALSAFESPLSNCDYCSGAFKKVQRQLLPSHVHAVRNIPLSPVQRGKIQAQEEVPLPHIVRKELYHEIQKTAPTNPVDQREVHRQRNYFFSTSEKLDGEHIAGMPTRKAPVQQYRPHNLLPHADSSELKALVERDHQTEFERKLDLSLFQVKFPPLAPVNLSMDIKRDQEIAEQLARMMKKSSVKRRSIADESLAFENLHKELMPVQEEVEVEVPLPARPVSVPEDKEKAERESEEQRISREFKEYEIESISHGPSLPPTPHHKDLAGKYMDEGFEEDNADQELLVEGSGVLMIDVNDQTQPGVGAEVSEYFEGGGGPLGREDSDLWGDRVAESPGADRPEAIAEGDQPHASVHGGHKRIEHQQSEIWNGGGGPLGRQDSNFWGDRVSESPGTERPEAIEEEEQPGASVQVSEVWNGGGGPLGREDSDLWGDRVGQSIIAVPQPITEGGQQPLAPQPEEEQQSSTLKDTRTSSPEGLD